MFARRCRFNNNASHSGSNDLWGGMRGSMGPCDHIILSANSIDGATTVMEKLSDLLYTHLSRITHPKEI